LVQAPDFSTLRVGKYELSLVTKVSFVYVHRAIGSLWLAAQKTALTQFNSVLRAL